MFQMMLSIKSWVSVLVRAATTASNLEAEQDSSNINKTQSKATPNESSNTLQSDEDSLKIDELMALCTTLQNSVLDLEKTTTTQRNEIASLKRSVKKLKKKNMSRTHKLKRLYKVGLMARVESSGNEESLSEDASKKERIDVIDADEEITLVSVQDEVVSNDADKEMFDVDILDGEEAKIDVDHQLTKRMQAQEQEELSIAEKATLFQQLLEKGRKYFAAKRAEEKRNKPPTKAQQRKIMVNTFEDFRTELVEGKEKRAPTELIQEITKKQKMEGDKETTKLKQFMEIISDEEEVAIDAIPLSIKSPKIVDWKIYKEGRKNYYQIMRADGKSQMYMVFSQMLKSFNKKYLEDLYKLVKAKYESTRPVEDLDLLLCGDLKSMFEPHVEDEIYMLVEKKYPLTPPTLSMIMLPFSMVMGLILLPRFRLYKISGHLESASKSTFTDNLIPAHKSYEYRDDSMVTNISIGSDILLYAGISSWAVLLWMSRHFSYWKNEKSKSVWVFADFTSVCFNRFSTGIGFWDCNTVFDCDDDTMFQY
uniref:Uncharacterized protein n=1 Tax=Tanacetum cinerariifolium TaxID=118510 RepID=A0A6L2K2J9_TANCI|nr:hypothetical protein [Tanacetum cinerariifolium]